MRIRPPSVLTSIALTMSLVVLIGMTTPIPQVKTTSTVIVKANGQNPLTLNGTEDVVITMSSPTATACQMVSPDQNGVNTSLKMTIGSTNPWYPKTGSNIKFKFVCVDKTGKAASDSVIVSRK